MVNIAFFFKEQINYNVTQGGTMQRIPKARR